VSIIQAMVCSSVPMSGAGMSCDGPMIGMISDVYRRVTRCSSPREYWRGSNRTPPFAPPYGTSTRAHFHVIHIARARTSSSVTSGLYRSPPLDGPLDRLCCTRCPTSSSTVPSSRRSGTLTVSSRRGVASMSNMPCE
jgi:hypothetical protein